MRDLGLKCTSVRPTSFFTNFSTYDLVPSPPSLHEFRVHPCRTDVCHELLKELRFAFARASLSDDLNRCFSGICISTASCKAPDPQRDSLTLLGLSSHA